MPGEEFPGDPRGECVFLVGDRCAIHAVKPFECRMALHGEADGVVENRHEAVKDAWDTPEAQQQIRDLLGREPEAEEWDDGDDGLFGWW
jgi:Fe-S-cluster containining protein